MISVVRTRNQECRGADDAEEFTRQRDKIIAAMLTIDADVVGLIEIENHPGDVPTADLVSGLNDEMGAGTYDYLATGAIGIGCDPKGLYLQTSRCILGWWLCCPGYPSFTDPLGYAGRQKPPRAGADLHGKRYRRCFHGCGQPFEIQRLGLWFGDEDTGAGQLQPDPHWLPKHWWTGWRRTQPAAVIPIS